MSSIVGAAAVFPKNYYSQEQITGALKSMWGDQKINLTRLEQFHQNMGIDGRHLVLELDEYSRLTSFQQSNRLYIEKAVDLGEQVICELLAQFGIAPQELDYLIFTTITGIAAPSIDALLMNRIPINKHVKRIPIFGWGCAGGAAGISRLADLLEGKPESAGLLLSVELCSLTIQHTDHSVENLISSGLFSDGASAVLMVGDHHRLAESSAVKVVASQPVFFPETEGVMGWEVRGSGLKIVLSSIVSQMMEDVMKPALQNFLAAHGLSIKDVGTWLIHPGGPKVMDAIQNALGLDHNDLALSWKTYREKGNLSSSAVLLILEETLRQTAPALGSYGLLMAMGPGFNAEFVLLQW